MYRPEIKVVDCTIRDGGLMNDSKFKLKTVREVYKAICASGVDYVELGYKNSKEMFPESKYGIWRHSDEEHLKKAVDGVDPGSTKVAVMMDAHKADPEDITPCSDSVIDMIRVATYVKDIDKAIYLAETANSRGYETTINIMAISHTLDRELDEALDQVSKETKAKACYIVDSFGALYSEDIDYFIEKYRSRLGDKIEIGVHCHNNQQLGFGNTIEGIIKGANYLDATLYGVGRGAGNCPLELLVGFLKNPKFNIRPLVEAAGKTIVPLQKEFEWGYRLPYMISGILNLHPLEAMEYLRAEKKSGKIGDIMAFYERMLEESKG
ncbi:MAG: aldolase catalytic domain-containing protein [Fibrobacterota bacterium]